MTVSRHPVDYLSLAFGLLFAVGGIIVAAGGVATASLAWIWPVAVIALGAIIILAARPRSGRGADVSDAD